MAEWYNKQLFEVIELHITPSTLVKNFSNFVSEVLFPSFWELKFWNFTWWGTHHEGASQKLCFPVFLETLSHMPVMKIL